jgi:cytochrome P450
MKDHFISNIPIKKDTAMAISTISTHYNEKYFKDPKVFKPERWEDS